MIYFTEYIYPDIIIRYLIFFYGIEYRSRLEVEAGIPHSIGTGCASSAAAHQSGAHCCISIMLIRSSDCAMRSSDARTHLIQPASMTRVYGGYVTDRINMPLYRCKNIAWHETQRLIKS